MLIFDSYVILLTLCAVGLFDSDFLSTKLNSLVRVNYGLHLFSAKFSLYIIQCCIIIYLKLCMINSNGNSKAIFQVLKCLLFFYNW